MNSSASFRDSELAYLDVTAELVRSRLGKLNSSCVLLILCSLDFAVNFCFGLR